jgi:hypothetical protein
MRWSAGGENRDRCIRNYGSRGIGHLPAQGSGRC